MTTTLRLRVDDRVAPDVIDVLDLLDRLAAQPGDIALLHTAGTAGGRRGPSVLAHRPLITFCARRRGARCRVELEAAPLLQRELPEIPGEPIEIGQALDLWQRLMNEVRFVSPAPIPDLVGWIGFVSYDAGTMLELPQLLADIAASAPLLRWQIFSEYYLWDAAARNCRLFQARAIPPDISRSGWSSGSGQAGMRRRSVGEPVRMEDTEPPAGGAEPAGPMAAAFPGVYPAPQKYEARVSRALEYISAGDIYQANLADRWVLPRRQRPEHLYRRMSRFSPGEYGAFLRFGNEVIASISPELFLRRRGDRIYTRPIKGTRARPAAGSPADQALARDLLASEKDRAELAMIVDLLRNDLGRVCRPGGVRVDSPRQLEALPTLWHTSASISGRLRSDKMGWNEIIRATCPGGSITGVPKIRAMRIIGELEAVPRGIYCGNIGWIGPEGDGALNIAIRTAHLTGDRVTFCGGAGIVAQSDPVREYAEIGAKVQALVAAAMEP